MGIKIEVDLATASQKDIVRAAQFMLEFAGFTPVAAPADEPPQAHAVAVPPQATLVPQPPQASLVPQPPQAPGIDVDSEGLPWDVRIHAGSKAKIADGTWRQKRNLAPELVSEVTADLVQTMTAEVPAPPPPPFVGSVEPHAPPVVITPPVPVSAGVAPAAFPGSATPTFPQLMQRITSAFHAKTLAKSDIDRAVAAVGLSALPMLASRPDLVAAVANELGIPL